MAMTLIERVHEIERISSTIEVDKRNEYEKVFEEFRVRNSLVGSVIQGETSFSAEAEKAIQIFKGNIYLPHYTNISTTSFQELREAIAYPNLNNFANFVANPLIPGILLGGEEYAMKRPEKKIMDRRTVVFAIFGAMVGGGFGLLGSAIRYRDVEDARAYAMNLDAKIKEVYKN